MHEVWAEFGPPAYVSAAHAIGFKPRQRPIVMDAEDFAGFMASVAPGGKM
jgi:hypothetical protein